MSAYLSPIGNELQADANGAPLVGGKIYSYLAGTTTPTATYTGSDGLTPQSNPIVLNSLGLPANPIWLGAGVAVKLVIKDANDVTIRTVDNVLGVNDPSSVTAQDQWVAFSGTPTYLSATTFSVAGDQTATLQVNRRVKTTNSGGTVYSTISASAFGAGVTTVTVVNDSGTLDAGLSAVSYGIISALNTSAPAQGTSDQTASRVKGTTYTNSTGRTIYVVVSGSVTANGNPTITVNGIAISGPQAYAVNAVINVSFAVGAGETYKIADGSGTFTISKWLETR